MTATITVDKDLVDDAVQLSPGKQASQIVEEALRIYIGQMGLKSMYGTMTDADFWIDAEGEMSGNVHA